MVRSIVYDISNSPYPAISFETHCSHVLYPCCTYLFFRYFTAQGPKAFFEQDVGPGEIFGEAALGGIHTRMQMAQAISQVDAIVIDDADFMAAQVIYSQLKQYFFGIRELLN